MWHEFAVETEDHLLAVEPLLARGDPEKTDAAEISELFRSFHSIKGIARAMDVLGMEAVAHHAENLLGLVRDGRVTLTPAIADLLLQAVDALKQLRGRVTSGHQDSPADPALLSRLAAAFAELGGAEVVPAGPLGAAPGDGDTASLHEDPEMLGIFVEMVKARGIEFQWRAVGERRRAGGRGKRGRYAGARRRGDGSRRVVRRAARYSRIAAGG